MAQSRLVQASFLSTQLNLLGEKKAGLFSGVSKAEMWLVRSPLGPGCACLFASRKREMRSCGLTSHHGAVACPWKTKFVHACAVSVWCRWAIVVAVVSVAGRTFDPWSSRSAVRSCLLTAAVTPLRMVWSFISAVATLSLVVFNCLCFSRSCKVSFRICSNSHFVSAEVKRFLVSSLMLPASTSSRLPGVIRRT